MMTVNGPANGGGIYMSFAAVVTGFDAVVEDTTFVGNVARAGGSSGGIAEQWPGR